MWIKVVVLVIFILSMYRTLEIGTVLFNKSRNLTEKGHKRLGIALTGLAVSGLQLFNVFDFIRYVLK